MKCEYCFSGHTGKYGSGRFCNRKCANGFSTKSKRSEINKKVSKTLTGRYLQETSKDAIRKAWEDGRYKRNGRKKFKVNELFKETPTVRNHSVIKRLLVEAGKTWECEICHLSKWLGEDINLQLHHINGNNKDNRFCNLQLLCPNCHSFTDNWCGKKRNNADVAQLDRAPAYEADG